MGKGPRCKTDRIPVLLLGHFRFTRKLILSLKMRHADENVRLSRKVS